MFCGVVDVSADRADVFAGCGFEYDFVRRDYFGRIRKIDYAVRGEAFERFRRVSAQPDGRARGAEGADAVECFPRRRLVFIDYGKLVLEKRRIGVGDVAVDEIEKPVGFHCDEAVARGVAGRGDVGHAVGDFLRGGEFVVGPVLEGGDGRVEWLYFVRLRFGRGADYRGVRESAEHAGVVDVLVRDQDLRDLFRLVALLRKRFDARLDGLAEVDGRVRRRRGVGEAGGQPRVDEDDLAAGVDDPVLEAGAVLDGRV